MCFVQYLSEKTVVEKSGFVIDIQGKESNHRSKIKANGEFLKLRQIHTHISPNSVITMKKSV